MRLRSASGTLAVGKEMPVLDIFITLLSFLNSTFYRLKIHLKVCSFYSILLQLVLTYFLLIFHGIGVSGIKCDLLLKIFKQM